MDRRLTTILAADMVGYSRLMAADEESVITRLRAARAEIIDPAIAEAGGRIVKTMGDGLLVEFPSPMAAVRMAVQTQETMYARELGPADQRIRFRIGVNTGDIVIDGDDILGDAVNIAARLESLAPPGGICIGRTTHDQIMGQIDGPLTALGPQMVKNIPDPVEVWRVEIEGVTAPTITKKAERPSIAVLPFDNMSADPDQEFLADGIVEDVITELSRFRSLLVIARNSTFAYKGAHKDIREIAKELDVRYVVEGSVRRAGDRLRVTAQLIEAATGAHIWAERWDRTMADLFDLQDELTTAIVNGVEPELGAHERALARQKPTENLTAWELCQKGFAAHLTFSEAGYTEAAGLYEAAVKADPNFALPHALLARLYANRITTVRTSDPAGDLRTGLSHTRKAIELDDKNDACHAAHGILLAISGLEQDSEEAFNKSLSLNPNNALAHHWRAIAGAFRSSPDAAQMEKSSQTALRLNPKDPLAWGFHFTIANCRLLASMDIRNEGLREAAEAASRHPNADYIAPMLAAVCNAAVSRDDAARRLLAAALAKRPGLTLAAWRTAYSFPVWPKMIAAMEPAFDTLVALGLPRE